MRKNAESAMAIFLPIDDFKIPLIIINFFNYTKVLHDKDLDNNNKDNFVI